MNEKGFGIVEIMIVIAVAIFIALAIVRTTM